MAGVKKLYFNPKFSGAFSGLQSFYKNRNIKLTKDELEKELLKIPEYYKFRPAKKKFARRRVMVHFVNFQITFDLIDMQKYKKENNNYRYILICLDAFSRKMYTVPIRDKTGKTLLYAMKKILKQMPKLPAYAHSDSGTEFTNRLLQNYFKSKGIIWFATHSGTKANQAERAIATLMGKLTRAFFHQKNHKYIKILPLITAAYNNTIHSSINARPNEVNESNQHEIWRYLYRDLLQVKKKPKPRYQVGDTVRISVSKGIFEKGYEKRWGDEIFSISKVKLTTPYTYNLVDAKGEEIKGGFYEPELLPAEKQ